MIKKLLATTVTLAALTFGSIIGLEAVGLLFQGGAPEPKIAGIQTRQHQEAALLPWREERGLVPGDTEEERRRREAEHQEAARQAQDEEGKLADAHRWAERYRRQSEWRLASLGHGPKVVAQNPPEAPSQAKPKAQRPAKEEPTLVGTLGGPGGGNLAPGGDMRLPVKSQPEQSGPRPARRPSARPNHKRFNRSGVGDDVACPLLHWLSTVFAQPAAPARRRPA